MNLYKIIVITLSVSITVFSIGCKTYENLPEMAGNVDINRFYGDLVCAWLYAHRTGPKCL